MPRKGVGGYESTVAFGRESRLWELLLPSRLEALFGGNELTMLSALSANKQ